MFRRLFAGLLPAASASRPARTFRPTLAALDAREVPASLAAGNLEIIGTAAADTVQVSHVTVGGMAKVRVVQNGAVQDFNAAAVTKQIRFWGNAGNDRFDYAGALSVYVEGGAGDDVINTGSGNDLVFGGLGNDGLYTNGGNDELQGNDGDDRLWSGAGNDLLLGHAGVDQLVGDAGNDDLVGGAGGDELWGMDGNDRLWGEAGLDFLLGGNGNDFLDGGADGGIAWGGAGNDRFVSLPPPRGFFLTAFVAPYTKTISGLPGIQDFAAGDTKDGASG